MSRRILFVLCTCTIPFCLGMGKVIGADRPSGPGSLFNQATILYGRQQYGAAATLFDSLIRQGYQDPVVYYDAGNAFYQSGHLGSSIYYLEKARALDPGNPFIKSNLLYIRQHLADHVESLPTLFFVLWKQQLTDLVPANGWVILSLILFWLLVGAIGIRLTRKDHSLWVNWGIGILACLLAISFSSAISRYLQVTSPGFAIVMETEVPVRNAPDPGSPDAFEVHEGLKVQVLDTAGSWDQIKMEDGRTGWVAGQGIRGL
ncbi:MAG TPA: SH3 domain-containing protein [Chitinophagaceae bacterium]|nr:SH3 domain-containing protein [Chitinophagaceae bacterium]